MQPKGLGEGIMISGFVDSYRGYGCSLTNEELTDVNQCLIRKGLPTITASPGHFPFKHGKNREGYWTGAHFSHQLNSILAVYETLHPDLQVVIEIDQSSCHLKKPEDGHYASGLNVGPGGREMKPSPPLTQECLGPGRKIVNIGDIQYYKYKADTELMMPLNNRGKKIKFNSKELLEGVNYGMVQILKNVGLMSVNSQEGRNW